jgi:hypothetical protein
VPSAFAIDKLREAMRWQAPGGGTVHWSQANHEEPRSDQSNGPGMRPPVGFKIENENNCQHQDGGRGDQHQPHVNEMNKK